MILTVNSLSGKRKWRLESFNEHMCWRLSKTNIDDPRVWINCECYQDELEDALESLADHMVYDPDDRCDMGYPLKDVKAHLIKVLQSYLAEENIEIKEII